MNPRRLLPLLCLAATCATAAPAGAVIGGERVAPADVPWYANVGVCGGTLIAPDRVVTATHCVKDFELKDLVTSVGGVNRNAAGVAMHPGWRDANGPGNVRDDIAVVQLDAPVPSVTPVAVGGAAVGGVAHIVGSGRATPPGSSSLQGAFGAGLHEGALRVMGDIECKTAFGRQKGNAGERLLPDRMLCAIDVDGRAPLTSGCNGDSGGPLYAGTRAAPRLLGVVSFGGRRCGADHTPSVFADASRYRAFLADPTPTWAPTTTTPARIAGAARVGGRLRCTTADVPKGSERSARWYRQGRAPVKVGTDSATYVVQRADRGRRIACFLALGNDGGRLGVPSDGKAVVRIAR